MAWTFSTPAVLILLATSALDRQQPDALGLDAPPQIAPSSAFDALRDWSGAYVDSELAAESRAHLPGDFVNLSLLGGSRAGRWDDERNVDVAAGPTLAASHAAEDVRLPHSGHLRQPSSQELLQRRLDLGFLLKQIVNGGRHDVVAVELIKVRTAGALHSGEPDLRESAQHLGGAVMRNIRPPGNIARTYGEPFG